MFVRHCRLLYVHDYFHPENDWRVYEALMLHTIGSEMLMLVVEDNGAIHVMKEFHLSQRNSAAFFVFADEFDQLAADIESDWERRRLWRKAYNDVQRLKANTLEKQSSPPTA